MRTDPKALGFWPLFGFVLVGMPAGWAITIEQLFGLLIPYINFWSVLFMVNILTASVGMS
ncbi:hypothetical protein [Yoonia sp.]|uniref:hypothetical protein n=1 Tax=Yoonia sp. TaxID=2212373 RepID=UPI002382D033|nr:hypothetical protein [Yoonia sp.]MDE0851232.1 hypothetical protein [Yoonia sp.]